MAIEYYKKTEKRKKIKKLSGYENGCWVNAVDPSEKEVEFLIERFKLDKDLVEDGLDVHEIPRIEEEGKKAYVYLTIPTSKVTNEYTSSFLIIISNNYFITISKNNLEIFDKIIRAQKDFLTNNKSRSLLQILLYLSNSYSVRIRNILKEVKKDRRNIRRLKEGDILDLVLQEDILNDYLSSFSPLINIHRRMLRIKSIKFKEDEKDFIEDLIVDLNQTLTSSETTLKTISNMRDYYQTTLSNSLNKILKVLTIFTVFMTIPAVLSGIYGMNISLPGQTGGNVFWLLAGIVILIWAIAFAALKKWKIF